PDEVREEFGVGRAMAARIDVAGIPDDNEWIGIRNRQLANENGVDQRINGRVRADAERQSAADQRRQERVSSQRAEAEGNILPQLAEQVPPTAHGVVLSVCEEHLVANGGEVAELPECHAAR